MGQASALGVFSSASSKGRAPRSSSSGRVDKDGDDSGEDHESELSDEEQEGLKVFEDEGGECKLVLVVRTDLGMGKGECCCLSIHFVSFQRHDLCFQSFSLQCCLNHIPPQLRLSSRHASDPPTPRQNRSTSLPRHPRLLQIPRQQHFPHPHPVAPRRPAKDNAPGQIGG